MNFHKKFLMIQQNFHWNVTQTRLTWLTNLPTLSNLVLLFLIKFMNFTFATKA